MYEFSVFDRSITFPFCRTDNGIGTKTLKNHIKSYVNQETNILFLNRIKRSFSRKRERYMISKMISIVFLSL